MLGVLFVLLIGIGIWLGSRIGALERIVERQSDEINGLTARLQHLGRAAVAQPPAAGHRPPATAAEQAPTAGPAPSGPDIPKRPVPSAPRQTAAPPPPAQHVTPPAA